MRRFKPQFVSPRGTSHCELHDVGEGVVDSPLIGGCWLNQTRRLQPSKGSTDELVVQWNAAGALRIRYRGPHLYLPVRQLAVPSPESHQQGVSKRYGSIELPSTHWISHSHPRTPATTVSCLPSRCTELAVRPGRCGSRSVYGMVEVFCR